MDSLQTRLFLSYLVIVAVTLGLSSVAIYILVDDNREPLTYGHLRDLAVVASAHDAAALANINRDGTSIVLVGADGSILPSDGGSSSIERLLDPETVAGLQSTDSPRRCAVPGGTAAQPMLCMLAPLPNPTADGAVAVAAIGPEVARGTVFGDFGPRLVYSGLTAIIAASVLGLGLSRSIAGPLHNIARAARRVGDGNFDERVPVTGPGEVRDLSRTFNRMTEKVHASQRTTRDFLANISHEFKTPLTSIRGFSGAVLDDTIDDPKGIKHAMTIVDHEAGRLLRLVEELLDLSRIESGQAPFVAERIDVMELLEHLEAVYAFSFTEKDVDFDIRCSQPLVVRGDLDRIEQVFQNLLSNALRHTPSGGVVTIGARGGTEGPVVFTVADTGDGIGDGDIDQVFDRFYRARSAGDGQGHGLGLAISREIVRGHGGDMWVESQPGGGARFSFTLPSEGQAERRVAARARRARRTA